MGDPSLGWSLPGRRGCWAFESSTKTTCVKAESILLLSQSMADPAEGQECLNSVLSLLAGKAQGDNFLLLLFTTPKHHLHSLWPGRKLCSPCAAAGAGGVGWGPLKVSVSLLSPQCFCCPCSPREVPCPAQRGLAAAHAAPAPGLLQVLTCQGARGHGWHPQQLAQR